ncbi:MAG TPA: DNA gyrase inhibitor YacG [Gammaproteobacteria bacterium]|nr:DNA gyrase inhibitor YacG [Gammaproteobacteria bacterium]
MAEIETVPCPHCGKSVPWTPDSKWKPFCSDRCRLIDLGDWLMEHNALPAEDGSPSDQEPSGN